MKKILFAIFAHPDDEAFGPSGTLVLESQQGADVHLVTLTPGQNGHNPDNHPNLGDVRLEEWRQSAALLGAHATHNLGYTDSKLCNTLLPEIQTRLIDLIQTAADTVADDQYEIEVMTLDDNGITGHIDHTVASRAATFAFYTLKAHGLPLTRIRYACLPRTQVAHHNVDWIYMPAGRTLDEIDEVVDAREVLATIQAVVRCHHTQREDGQAHVRAQGDALAINHFMVRT